MIYKPFWGCFFFALRLKDDGDYDAFEAIKSNDYKLINLFSVKR